MYQYLFHFQDGYSPYERFEELNRAFIDYDDLLIEDYLEYNGYYNSLVLDYKFKHFAPDFVASFYVLKPQDYDKRPEGLFDDKHQIAKLFVSQGNYLFNNDNITFTKNTGLFKLTNTSIEIKQERLLAILNDSKIRSSFYALNPTNSCQLFIYKQTIKRAKPGFKTYLAYHLITLFYNPYPANKPLQIKSITNKGYCN